MRCPFATWKPVPSFGAPMSGHLGAVIHVTASESDPWPWFDNPADQASSHFFIGNGQGAVADGALEQYIDTEFESWAQMSGNPTYISVETEGEPTDPLTDAQVATFARLYRWLAQAHGIPFVITDTPGEPGFITHGDGGTAWGGHTDCPGPLRTPQREAILAIARKGPLMKLVVLTATDVVGISPTTGHLEQHYADSAGWHVADLSAAADLNVELVDFVDNSTPASNHYDFRCWGADGKMYQIINDSQHHGVNGPTTGQWSSWQT